MKKIIVLGLVLAMVMGLAAVASATTTDWLIYMKATDQVGGSGLLAQYIYGCRTGATDGFESSMDAASAAGTGAAVVLGCIDLGVGSYNTGYNKDLRAPITTVGEQKTWNLKLYVQGENTTATSILFKAWNPTGTYDLVDGSLALPVTVTVKDQTGKTYEFLPSANGTSTTPQLTWELPVVYGYANAYDITLVAGTTGSIVPEPGSMLAMLSGLVGLVGFGIRRRK